MTEVDYDLELKKIEDDYKIAKSNLYKKFAKSNIIYNIGDIITNCNTEITIMVEKYGTYVSSTEKLPKPIYIYIGIMVKKDLTPKKSKEIGNIYGNENNVCLKKGSI